MLQTSSPRRRAAHYRRSSPARKIPATPRRHEEERIHLAIVQHLETRGVPGLLWFHVGNEGQHRAAFRAKQKRLGAKAGVSDLILFHEGKFFALEVKSEAGRTTDAQRDFIDVVNGGNATIGFGLNQCLKILEAWQLLTG